LVPGGLATPGAPAVEGGGGRVAEAKVSAMVFKVKSTGTFVAEMAQRGDGSMGTS